MKELWVLYIIEHKGINSIIFFKKSLFVGHVINMYVTLDPSPGDFWGLLTGIQLQSHPSQVLPAAGRVPMLPEESKEKGPRCSWAAVSRANPSMAQVETEQSDQGEVFKMSLQSMFGNQMQS